MDLEETPSKKPHHLPYNFPNIWCPNHEYPIILACIRPNCRYPRTFLCSKCLHHELAHVNEHTPLHTFEDFVNLIAKEDSPLIDVNKNDNIGLVSQINENVSEYSSTIKHEQSQLKKIAEEFNEIFQDTCGELVSLLECQLSNINEKFQERYQRLENELLIDDLANARLPKFKEISAEVSKLKSSEKQCSFLKEILQRRQAWETACPELKEIPKKSYEFYEKIIEEQMSVAPKLQNRDELIDTWTKGLRNLVQKVYHQAQIGDNSSNENQYIWLNLEKIDDLELLCDEMLRPETLLCYKPKKSEKLHGDSIAECLSRLVSLRALALDFSLFPLKTEDLKKAVSSLSDLTNLKALEINLAGVGVQSNVFPELLKQLKSCKGVEELSLNLSQNNLSGISDFIEGLSDMKHLIDLNLNLSGAKIDSNVVETLVLSLRAMKHLENLGLNLSGFSLSGPALDKKSAFKLVGCFSDLTLLKKFSLDLGYNKLNDEHISDLADSLKRLSSMRHLELILNNNNLEDNGCRKLKKVLAKSHLNSLYLNLHSNELKEKGVDELLKVLEDNRKWVKIEINLRNVGLTKSQANEFHQKWNKDNIKLIF